MAKTAAGIKDLSKKTPSEIALALNNSISVFSDIGKDLVVDSIPTGLSSLDWALGCGGLPRGRIIELFGSFGSTKTSLSLHLASQVQSAGGVVAFIDAEHALNEELIDWFGIDKTKLLFHQPDSGESALDLVHNLMRTKAVTLAVVDSVAALVPIQEIERSFSEPTIGLQARMMSSALRKLSVSVSEARAILVFINQTRSKIGVFFGNNVDTSGGQALKFYAGQRLEVTRTGQIKKNDKVIGIQTRVKVVKNKVSTPFRIANLELIFNKGFRENKAAKEE